MKHKTKCTYHTAFPCNFLNQQRRRITNSNCADKTRLSERFSEVPNSRRRQHKTRNFNSKEMDLTCLLSHFSTFINIMSESTINSKPLKIRWSFPLINKLVFYNNFYIDICRISFLVRWCKNSIFP
jgi:hypothetical protein